MSVSAILSHCFDVSQFGSCAPDEHINGAVQSVVHNMVHLDFMLIVIPNDSRAKYADHLGIYVKYIGGPQNIIPMNYGIFIAVNGRLTNMLWGNCNRGQIECGGSGFGTNAPLPRTAEALAKKAYLCQNNTQLHILAQLSISLSAFEDPSDSHGVDKLSLPEATQAGHIDSLRLSLFLELKTPVAIQSAKSDRIEIKGTDETWWAHKKVLSHASEVFAGWFDPNKPLEALNNSLKKGRLEWTDLSDDVIQHMLYVIYLGCAGQGFDELAFEIIEPAERFKIKHLKEMCERTLIKQLDKMVVTSVDDLFAILVQADKFDLAQLKSSAAAKLCQSTEAIDVEPDKFLKMLADVRKLKLVELNEWCVKWMKKNYLKFNKVQLKQLIDNTGEEAVEQSVIGYLIQTLCTAT